MSMKLSEDIWERHAHGEQAMEWGAFFGLFIVSTAIALLTSAWIVSALFTTQINPWLALVVGLVGGFGGIFIATASANPFISFFGLELLASSFGVMLTNSLQLVAMEAELGGINFADIITESLQLTALATGLMMILGFAARDFFTRIGGILFGGLCALIVVMFGQIVLAMFGITFDSTPIHWIAVGLFCMYIGHDISLLTQMERTADNAVDAAVAVYLDIINLFLHILRLVAESKD